MKPLKVFKKQSEKSNVIGTSKTLKPKLVDGKPVDEMAVRIYVKKKLPESVVAKSDLVPKKIGIRRIKTDVIEIGDIKALPVDKTANTEEPPLGWSVGHWDITAGSLGMLYNHPEYGECAGSNAHILTPDAKISPSDMKEFRICVPGPYHISGDKQSRVAGKYLWHDQILPMDMPSDCQSSKTVANVLNMMWSMFNRQTRFSALVAGINHQDFGVYTPVKPHSLKIADGSFDPKLLFIGHLFAGSDMSGIICKVKYAVEKGYYPLVDTAEVQVGDMVCGCSFWCNYTTDVLDESAILQVGYGNFTAVFDDVIIVNNEAVLKGGWSGSGWRKVV